MVGENQYMERSRIERCRHARGTRAWQNYEVKNPIPNSEWFGFSKGDSQGVLQDQSDALVIIMPIAGVHVHCTLADNESSVNILFSRTLRQLEISEHYLQPYPKRLQRFFENPIEAKWQTSL